jgi:hypothetical protein
MSNDDDDGESSDDMASAEIEDDRNQRRLMAERNARIRQNKLRGVDYYAPKKKTMMNL